MTSELETGPRRFAALLCDWCLEVAPGQQVLIGSTTLAEPLLTELHAAMLDRDAWPHVRAALPSLAARGSTATRATGTSTRSRRWTWPRSSRSTRCSAIDAPANASALADIDPALVQRAASARVPVREARLGAPLVRDDLADARRWRSWPGCRTTTTPSSSPAPCSSTGRIRSRPGASCRTAGARGRQRLTAATPIRIEADGTDITLDVGGRTWINSDGRRNMPSGEVFTGPHERSANGTIHFTVPTGPRGVTVTGVTLTFRDGEVVHADRRAGPGVPRRGARDRRRRPLPGRARDRHERRDRSRRPASILLDEKMAGTVHLALGRSYPETGGHERLGAALGPDLRSASGRSAERRRRAGGRRRGVALETVRRSRGKRSRFVHTHSAKLSASWLAAAPRSSPRSDPRHAIRRRWCGWSRPGWTSPGSTSRTAAASCTPRTPSGSAPRPTRSDARSRSSRTCRDRSCGSARCVTTSSSSSPASGCGCCAAPPSSATRRRCRSPGRGWPRRSIPTT